MNALVKQDIKILLLVVDTEGRRVQDSPENYALLVSELLLLASRDYKQINHIIIDRHFTWIHQRERFNKLLQAALGKDLFVEHLDSSQNTIVSLADFIAGAVREFYVKEKGGWRKIIQTKVAREVKFSWKKLKQRKAKA